MHSPPTAQISPTHFVVRLATLTGLLAAFALRLHRLGAESLWYDETVSAFLARQSLPDLLAHTARDIHPPGYYLLLQAWTLLGSVTPAHGYEFYLAFFSLWFGVLTVALLAPLAKDAIGKKAAPIAVCLGAISPFLIWYSQEVRMYTLAGALGLLCLYAATRYVEFVPRGEVRQSARWLTAYVVAAALALYTLYYSALALAAVNLGVGWSLWRRRPSMSTGRTFSDWLLAQFSVLALFLPWAPIMLRQVFDPPVPAWRVPWTSWASAASDLALSLSALLVGQSVPASQVWLWAVMTVLVLWSFVRYTKIPGGAGRLPHAWSWYALYLAGPIVALFLVSFALAPVFHVRYLAAYAPAFSVVVAGGVLFALRRKPAFGLILVSLVATGSIYSLDRFWTHPDYVSDDHRGAVQKLASAWRPGDVVLVNAGWVYTAVDIYWPADWSVSTSACATNSGLGRPAPLSEWARLPAATESLPANRSDATDALVSAPGLMTGSIDGPPSLGWGSPQADFFPMSGEDATAALEALKGKGYRIWHYRLYDTVSDPGGVLRTWLHDNMRLADSQPFAGRDYLRLELYEPLEPFQPSAQEPVAMFGSAIALLGKTRPITSPAGETIYVPIDLRIHEGSAAPESPISASLRLVGPDGLVWAQQDMDVLPADGWTGGAVIRRWLSLLIPVITPPGEYGLDLVLYRQDNLAPLPVIDGISQQPAQSHRMAATQIELPVAAPRLTSQRLTIFDYLELVRSCLGGQAAAPGDTILLDLLWRPRPNAYSDNYEVRIDLVNADAAIVQTWREPLGGGRYPSGGWPESYPVRDLHPLHLAHDLPPGDYTIRLALERAEDGLPIAARRPWSPFTSPSLALGTLRITAPAQ